MFMISDDEARAVRLAFTQGGRDAAMVELRRHWRGLDDEAAAEVLAGILPAPEKPEA